MMNPISVLLVDDEKDLLIASTELLGRSGNLMVSGVSSPEEALELLKTRKFDVIVSDYQMKGMNGIEFLKYLKANDDPTPFILFTGKSREDIAIEALNNGAAFYLQKGESIKAIFAELESKIRAAGSHRRAIEELNRKNEEIREQYVALQRSEENLKNTTDLLENLVHIAQSPIIVWDPSFHIIRLNQACENLIGRSAEEVIGTPVELLFSPGQADRTTRLFQAIRDGARWETTELDLMHTDGTVRNILWNTSTLYAADGTTPVATIAQGNDVTDELKLKIEKNKAIEEIQKNLAQLAILNDGIRNPLTIITLYAEQCGTDNSADQIFQQTHRIDEMVSTLDQRWVESEKVLRALRKHYQIDPVKIADSGYDVKPDISGIPEQDTSLIEEVKARLFTILDSIDAFVYVADIETCELLYTNRQGRAMLGNIIGKKCYQTLHPGFEGPCQFCSNRYLTTDGKPTGVYRWEYHNETDGRWYDCRDRAIRWNDGRLVHLTISTDITERRESEILFRGLFDTMPSGVGIYSVKNDGSRGSDYIITDFNRTSLQIEGKRKEEVVGKSLADLRPTIDDYGLIPIFQKVWKTGETVFYPAKVYVDDVYTNWYENYVFRLPTGQIVAIYNDVTESKRAEEALQQSEERLRLTLDATNDGIWDWNIKTGFAIFSPRWYTMIGYEPGELPPTYDTWRSLIHPDDLQLTEQKIADHIQKKDTGYVVEFRMRTKKGEWVWILARGKVIEWDSAGNPVRMVGTHSDITERKRAEETLKESEEKFRLLHENAGIGIGYYTPDGIVISYNQVAAGHMGGLPEDFSGKSLFELFPKEDADRYYARILKAAQSDVSDVYEDMIPLPSGNKYFLSTFTKITDSEGTVIGIQIISQDITERKQAEETLRLDLKAMKVLQKLSSMNTGTGDLSQLLTEIVDAAIAITFADFGNIQLVDPETNVLRIVAHRNLPDWWLAFWDTVNEGKGTCGTALESRDRVIVSDIEESPIFAKTPALEIQHRAGIRAVQSTPLISRDGRVLGMFSTHFKTPYRPDERQIRLLDLLAREAANILERKRAETNLLQKEEALQESRDLLDETQKITKVGGWEWDIRKQTMKWTDETYRIHGMVPGDIPPGSPEHIFRSLACYDPADRPIIEDAFRRCVEEGESYDVEVALIRVDGQRIWVRTIAHPVKEGSRVVKVVGNIMDITENRQIREALRYSEERLRLAHKATNDVVWDWDVLTDTQQWNEAGTKVFGWTEIVERPVNAQWWVERVHPDDRDRIHDGFFAVVNDPTADVWSDEYRFLKTDGTYADVMDRGYVLRDKEGRAYRMIGAMLDISDRKHAENALVESQSNYCEIFNSTSEAIMIDDAGTGKIIDVNNTTLRMYGYDSKEEILAGNIGDLSANIPPYDENEAQKRIRQCIEEGPQVFEWLAKKKNGEIFWAEVSLRITEIGGEGRILAVVRDISRRKLAEETLYESNQKLRLLTTLTRHDVTNKLTALHLFHDMASRESDLAKKDEYIITAEQAVEQVEAIIRFTREYEDFGIVASRWQKVQSIVRHAVSETNHTGILIEENIPPYLQIFADPIIQKVFSTLIENALRHAGHFTRIQFSCQKSGRDIIIVCEDDGCGIPQDEKERIFDHGFGRNTGLGLFLVREILAITGLSIRETGAPGKGARFEILVPERKWQREK